MHSDSALLVEVTSSFKGTYTLRLTSKKNQTKILPYILRRFQTEDIQLPDLGESFYISHQLTQLLQYPWERNCISDYPEISNSEGRGREEGKS